jgi:hypothetical protein
MPDEKRDDEIVDEMPDTGGAPCGQIFAAEAEYVTDADDDEMPPPGADHCGDPFASSQVVHVTDADDA